MLTVYRIQYDRMNIQLLELCQLVPFTLRQELGIDSRRRVLFAHWATVMERMSSQIKWIWGNDAYLRYVPINGMSFLKECTKYI